MAWLLRQFIEGDRQITVANVSDEITSCWINSQGNYIPNTIAIKINGIEYILPTVNYVDNGFLSIKVPNNIIVTATTKIQVYSVCNNNPEFRTLELTALPIKFEINTGGITNCSSSIDISPTMEEYIRLFITTNQSEYFTLFASNNIDLNLTNFNYQTGTNGNITTSGNFPNYTFVRPLQSIDNSILFSKISYTTPFFIDITPKSKNYFTIRLGFLEIIFDGTNLNYTDYSSSDQVMNYVSKYEINEIYRIASGGPQYFLYKVDFNATELLRINKNVYYNVSGGNITHQDYSTGLLFGFPFTWNLPSISGQYTIEANINSGIKFQKTVTIHPCGNAVNDYFIGTQNQPFTSNVSLNDNLCIGEKTYVSLVGNSLVNIKTLDLLLDGAFILTTENNFIGTSQFTYHRYCGNDITGYEIVGTATVYVDFNNLCESLDPIWVDTGRTECRNCKSYKEQEDTNSQCSGTTGNRWIQTIVGEEDCENQDNWQDTNEFKCEVSRKFVRQINLNNCNSEQERWFEVGISDDCECLGEIYIDSCCTCGEYYPIVTLLENTAEENRAIQKCLIPDIGEKCLIQKKLNFKTENDGLPHDYLITLLDCKQKIITQIKLLDYNCAGITEE